MPITINAKLNLFKSADIRANALKAQEATEEVQNLNAELMGEVLSLLASIVRLTEGLAGVEDIHASAEVIANGPALMCQAG